jgi:hypothetical protein
MNPSTTHWGQDGPRVDSALPRCGVYQLRAPSGLKRGRCNACYAYWHRSGKERPPHLWGRDYTGHRAEDYACSGAHSSSGGNSTDPGGALASRTLGKD